MVQEERPSTGPGRTVSFYPLVSMPFEGGLVYLKVLGGRGGPGELG